MKKRALGCLPSLKLIWPLKMDSWKMNFLLGRPIFRGYVSFREGSFFVFFSGTPLDMDSLLNNQDSMENIRVFLFFSWLNWNSNY